ncbi:hypothetical protein LCGC14_2891110 [marine sediment metagenome]|uniref:Uncharacterized protein n=1 Tax=marine sediment metagenome TaxID=412755 RepID=A0A0F8YIZ2_9ZZZZ
MANPITEDDVRRIAIDVYQGIVTIHTAQRKADIAKAVCIVSGAFAPVLKLMEPRDTMLWKGLDAVRQEIVMELNKIVEA